MLQQCKTFKNSLCKWNGHPTAENTYKNFKKHFHNAPNALHKTGKITVKEGLNHAAMFDMVLEGVHVALADNYNKELANNVNETEQLYH